MITDVLVREATQQDIPAVVELWKQLMDMHKELDPCFALKAGAEGAFAQWVGENIAGEDGHVVVAELDGQIVGYSQARVIVNPPVLELQRYCQLHDCFVAADMRGKGIGRLLTASIRDWAAANDLKRIEVRHSVRNPGAGAFWLKVGFQPYLARLYMEL